MCCERQSLQLNSAAAVFLPVHSNVLPFLCQGLKLSWRLLNCWQIRPVMELGATDFSDKETDWQTDRLTKRWPTIVVEVELKSAAVRWSSKASKDSPISFPFTLNKAEKAERGPWTLRYFWKEVKAQGFSFSLVCVSNFHAGRYALLHALFQMFCMCFSRVRALMCDMCALICVLSFVCSWLCPPCARLFGSDLLLVLWPRTVQVLFGWVCSGWSLVAGSKF